MILAALRAKFAARGPLGFASDAAELALACTIVGVSALAMAGAALAAAVVGTPVLALELLARPEPSDRPSNTDDCAAESTSCRNGEERGS